MENAADLSHYEMLGIPVSAGAEEIKRAYRRLAMRWHPDRNLHGGDEADRRFKLIGAAYDVLSDPVRRDRYDRSRGARGGPYTGGEAAWHSPVRGCDASGRVSITLEQALSGCEVEVSYAALEYCAACGGDGELIPGYACRNCGGSGKKEYANGLARCRKCGG